MRARQVADTAGSFADTVLAGPKVVGATGAVLAAVLWESFGSVLAGTLGLLFLADLLLGVAKAVHEGGIDAFDWNRFWRAWIKMFAAITGIAVFVAGDLLLHQTGVPQDWRPLTGAGLLAMCWGFFASALVSIGYFFPNAKAAVEGVLRRVRAPDESRPGDPEPEGP